MGVVYHSKGRYYTLKGKYKNEHGEWVDYERSSAEYQFKKKTDAQTADKALRKELSKKSKSRLSKGMTFAEVADAYFNMMRMQRKATTINTDVKSLKAIGGINNMQIDMIKTETLQKFFNDMDKNGNSLNYIKKLYTTVRKIFNYAMKENIISDNPMDDVIKITRPNEVKNDSIKFWTPAEFNIFISLVSDLQYFTLFNFLYHTGCRKGEALALTWEDIDFNKRTFHINKTCSQGIKGIPYLITPPKTPNSYRTKRMGNTLTHIMKDWYDYRSNLYGFNDKCFVFGSLDKPLPTSNLEKNFKLYRDYANGWVSKDMIIGGKQDYRIGDLVLVEGGLIKNNPHGDRNLRNRVYEKELVIDQVSDSPDDPCPYHVRLPINEIPVHGLRHSHATLLINNIKNGANIKAIADRLGDTVEQLLKTYAHLFQETEDELIDIIDKQI